MARIMFYSCLAFHVCLATFIVSPTSGSRLYDNVFGTSKQVSNRVLSTTINPGCKLSECTDNTTINLVYTKSVDANSTTHSLWSTIGGAPGFFIVESGADGNLNVNWNDLMGENVTGSVSIGNVVNALGLVVTKVYFWNDTANTGVMDINSNDTDTRSWSDFNVTDVRPNYSADKDSANAQFLLEDDSGLNVTLNLYTSASEGRISESPRLSYTPSSFHLEVVLNGPVNDSLKNQRVGLEFVLLHRSPFIIDHANSIDDEYSPGVFTVSLSKTLSSRRQQY